MYIMESSLQGNFHGFWKDIRVCWDPGICSSYKVPQGLSEGSLVPFISFTSIWVRGQGTSGMHLSGLVPMIFHCLGCCLLLIMASFCLWYQFLLLSVLLIQTIQTNTGHSSFWKPLLISLCSVEIPLRGRLASCKGLYVSIFRYS